MAGLMRHRQTKGPETDRPRLTHRATSRLYRNYPKYRNKIGADVALEALRDCWRKRKATMDDLWKYAKVCRMTKVMKPYLESIT